MTRLTEVTRTTTALTSDASVPSLPSPTNPRVPSVPKTLFDLAEVAFHQRRWLAASGLAGLTIRLVEARAAFAGRFLDLRGDAAASHPARDPDLATGWPAGQALADQARTRHLDGIVWPSVRDPARGDAYALLDRHAVRAPRWGATWRLQLDGLAVEQPPPAADTPLLDLPA